MRLELVYLNGGSHQICWFQHWQKNYKSVTSYFHLLLFWFNFQASAKRPLLFMASFCCRHEMVEEKCSFDEIFCSTSQMKEQNNYLVKAWGSPINTLTLRTMFTLQYSTGLKRKKKKGSESLLFGHIFWSFRMEWNDPLCFQSILGVAVVWNNCYVHILGHSNSCLLIFKEGLNTICSAQHA